MSLPEYDAIVEKLNTTMDEFKEFAEGGKDGRGSKSKALQARKLSMRLTSELKEFRAESIKNDKSK